MLAWEGPCDAGCGGAWVMAGVGGARVMSGLVGGPL